MHIEKIAVENFRLLKNSTLELRDRTTLLVGKNNTGKTSFAVLLEKFLSKTNSFDFDDFPIGLRANLLTIDDKTNVDDLSIRLILKISYDENDDISVLSRFMLDLDGSRRHTNILLECQINQEKLVRDQPSGGDERKKFFENYLEKEYLEVKIYAFDDYGHLDSVPYYLSERPQLEEKSMEDLKKLLHFQVIHARRNVASSEESGKGANPLASISTQFLKKRNSQQKKDTLSAPDEKNRNLDKIERLLSETDASLNGRYLDVFKDFLSNANKFLGIEELKIISNLQSQTLLENSSKIVYGETSNALPENHNGLGYLNILYLLLRLEMVREEFEVHSATLNLLIIEEPEAHTHPQMQYIFADQIKELIGNFPKLQAVLTTHSSHIVSKSDFEDIRYLSKTPDGQNVEIKNFHTELQAKFDDVYGEGEGPRLFNFLSQYLSINSAELFFAEKVIFIEGTTERMLLPLFIKNFDEEREDKASPGLSSQNITALEVGANAKAFAPFLDFLKIKSLIITDIDTTTKTINGNGKNIREASSVSVGDYTSNATIKFFFDVPNLKNEDEISEWVRKLKSHENKIRSGFNHIHVAYQAEEDGYHARSFEDAFIALNFQALIKNKDSLEGLKNKAELVQSDTVDFYVLTQQVIDKKSDFASSLLLSALADGQSWVVPSYISEGLKWLHKD